MDLTVIKAIEDKNPVTNGKFHVICQTKDGKTVEGASGILFNPLKRTQKAR